MVQETVLLGVSFKGEDCMKGPYRPNLPDQGAFGLLLRAAITSVFDEQCDMIVKQV